MCLKYRADKGFFSVAFILHIWCFSYLLNINNTFKKIFYDFLTHLFYIDLIIKPISTPMKKIAVQNV